MERTMKALMYDRPGRENSSVCEIPYPVCGDDEIIIKVMSCSICKGQSMIMTMERVRILQNIRWFQAMSLQAMFMK